MNSHNKVGIYVIFIQNMIMGEVQFDGAGINWFNASIECKVKGLGLEHDNFTLSNFDELKGQTFWIGIIKYRETSPWLETIGCFYFKGDNNAVTNLKSIVECQLHCNSSVYLSYQKFTGDCRCLMEVNDTEKVSVKNCSSQFPLDDKALVYKRFDFNDIYDVNDDKDCIVSVCESNVKLHAYSCENAQFTVKTLCEDGNPPSRETFWTYNYSNARQKCYETGKQLLSTEVCDQNRTRSWTNAFRKTKLVEYFDAKSEDVTPVECLTGTIVNTTGKQELQLLPESCHDKLNYYACKVYKPNHIVMATKEPSITVPLVGGLIGGSLVICVSICILIWKFRRSNKDKDKKNKTEELSKKQEQKHEIHGANLQCGLVEEDVKHLPYNPVVKNEYTFVDKSVSEFAEVEMKNSPAPDTTYSVATEDEYEQLNNLSRKITRDGNVYGIAGLCGEDEYNTINSLSASNIISSNGLYDINTTPYKGNDKA